MARYLIDNRPEPIDFGAESGLPRVIQNCKNLLMCRTGEVPYDRNRGLNAKLLEKPVGYLNARLLPELERTLALAGGGAALAGGRAYLDEDGETIIEAVIQLPD